MQIQTFALAWLLAVCGREFQHNGLLTVVTIPLKL